MKTDNTNRMVEYITEFGDDTSVGFILSQEYSEDWEENEYEVLGSDGIVTVPERGIINFLDED